ncbi:glycerol:H+ symporter-like protein [Aureobasidium pullulans]|uniref:Glycerol:H+ symporter-like protein n=1 Tax=Aureobasidium pullulans TaxID=5580 RepID=A0A4S9KEA4_AURPU|nr:glycerol:H+ symporter-like protein [Aureobasidium pullulans]THY14297.1 glycerol:H+ symporter-like protein [Aureobasidium pullulans]
MSWLSFIKKLYSLDTLDTRFTTSTKTPHKLTPEDSIADSKLPAQQILQPGKEQSLPGTQPSKWNTPEFYFYYICFLTIPVFMVKAVYDVSQESHPNYSRYSHLLSGGWIPGRKVDNSDSQYAGFRDNIPYMTLLLILHPLLRKAYNSFWRIDSYTKPVPSSSRTPGLTQGLSPSAAADARMEHRISFDVYFAIIFIFALHGFSALKVLLILYTNYKLATQLPKAYVPAATWIFNVGILFANELCHGYPMAEVAAFVLPSQTSASEKANQTPGWAGWIDSYGGILPRWEILFNITVLRLISFNLDYYWSLSASSSLEKKQLDPSNLSERDRVSVPSKPVDFSFRNYLAYALYSPLYLAGPILTFNDYISQSRYPLASITTKRTLMYGLRFLICVLTMEFCLHFLYAVAISKAQPAWEVYSPMQLSMLGYFNLHIIWLKLLIPWRFFRLWSLADGIDPPENMVRCMSDNYSALAFWRGWHRSFNRWIVRYIYIPIGGSGQGKVRAIGNFLAVFTFVALWHDINLKLLIWGWLITLFVLPEVLCTLLFPAKKWKDSPDVYRWICGVGATGNILMMMAANLVGFAIGVDGLKAMVGNIVGSLGGWAFLLGACGTLFVGAQVMFEVRESEKRKGINMKC